MCSTVLKRHFLIAFKLNTGNIQSDYNFIVIYLINNIAIQAMPGQMAADKEAVGYRATMVATTIVFVYL